NLKGANLSHADLSGADLRGANLRNAILIGTEMNMADTRDCDMAGVLTDKDAGKSIASLNAPLDRLLADHDRFVRSGGAEGRPLDLSGFDLRKAEDLVRYSLAAMKAAQAVFYGLDLNGIKLQAAQLERADFRACRLGAADLR